MESDRATGNLRLALCLREIQGVNARRVGPALNACTTGSGSQPLRWSFSLCRQLKHYEWEQRRVQLSVTGNLKVPRGSGWPLNLKIPGWPGRLSVVGVGLTLTQ